MALTFLQAERGTKSRWKYHATIFLYRNAM